MKHTLNEPVYYRLETDASDGCNHWDWVLVRGIYDKNGNKDRSTEKRIVFGACGGEISDCWNTIDSLIRGVLGFVPDYEVN